MGPPTTPTARVPAKKQPEKVVGQDALPTSQAMRHYATQNRAEILAEYLEEQFTPHPTSDLREASHQTQVERRIQEFLSAPVPPLPGDYYISPAETAKAIFRL
ncbi:hypothetical protein EVAR_4036_1 [Eumeta japonica]|uniref:Uncharacterized protein n=1 Tax=Eumeta variegata TaxID=151549 RepID=A0A4C1T7B6_EUMVA|nr:hypothetical protein EVAR_4036_1 [Eumeta japonica]